MVGWRRRRRRSACPCGRAAEAVEEAGSSGVDGGGGDRQSRDHAVGI
jgi:hypothetical protein